MATQRRVEVTIRLAEDAKAARSNFDTKWQDAADYILPERDFTVKRAPGERRRDKVFNATAPLANDSLASALHGLLSNSSIVWFILRSTNPKDNENQEFKTWLYLTTLLMLEYFNSPQSNFMLASHELYLDIGSFGTGVCLTRRRPGRPLRFEAQPLADTYVCEDDDGQVVEVYQFLKMRARDIVKRWGEDNAHRDIVKASKDPAHCNELFEILHAIYKREDHDPLLADAGNKPWASEYIDLKNKKHLSIGGFDRLPRKMVRWAKASGEAYGTGPGVRSLNATKTVNLMTKDVLISGELANRPPLNAPATGYLKGPIYQTPGAVNYYTAGSRDRVEPMHTGADPRIGVEMIQLWESRIEQFFFLDVLKLPDRDRMTATEIIERRQQGLLLASPQMSRMYTEWLQPAILEVYMWMKETGQLPPLPQGFEGRTLTVDYVSPMAMAQKASLAQNIIRVMEDGALLIQAKPEVMDNIDADRIMRDLVNLHNANPQYLNTINRVRQLRDSRNRALAADQVAETAQKGAKAAKDLAAASAGGLDLAA